MILSLRNLKVQRLVLSFHVHTAELWIYCVEFLIIFHLAIFIMLFSIFYKALATSFTISLWLFSYFTCFDFSNSAKIAALWLCCCIWSLHTQWFVWFVWFLWWNCDWTVKFKLWKFILTWVLNLWHHMLQRHVSANSKIIIKTRLDIFQN